MLSKDVRRVVCIHEAGHAVIHALGGTTIHRVAVAPEGSASWAYQTEREGAEIDLWGACEPSGLGMAWTWCKWDGEHGVYLADRKGFNDVMSELKAFSGAHAHAARHRYLRAYVCGLLAGPIAESIVTNAAFDISNLNYWSGQHHDIPKAQGLSGLLPRRNELSHLITMTEAALRTPAIWARVVALADELEKKGELDDVDEFLPDVDTTWPPSPRSKNTQSAGT
ncbi:hypothetical protein BZM27_50715 [Paraburkholderia steynii]|uniref:Peptidase M41 domain-containing protein n=1 Tax=Paraburkholderia steynii TaxID=1245441 RepID=A0A4R0XB60_9BURK|nr:hypothetical protein BZM27_50715 [Paraburkholderia steynii]